MIGECFRQNAPMQIKVDAIDQPHHGFRTQPFREQRARNAGLGCLDGGDIARKRLKMRQQPAGDSRKRLGPMQHAEAATCCIQHRQMPEAMLAEQGNGAPEPLIRGAGDQRRGHGGGERCLGAKLKRHAARDILFGQNANGTACVSHHHQGRSARRRHGGDGLFQGRCCGQYGRRRTHGSTGWASQHGDGGVTGFRGKHGLI
jgi:hypothetical protein